MKVQSLTILHYGKDYLPYAIRSVYDQVDLCHIFYTPTPSHGHQTNIPPPEKRDELIAAAYDYDPDDKVLWYDMVNVTHEGPQRDLALRTVRDAGADLVLVADCDEIWPDDLAAEFLGLVERSNSARNWLANMVHFWRSFGWACSDQGWPVRIIDLRQAGGTAYLPRESGRIYHFGYAVRDKIMRYKWRIHGHKNELRPEWFDTKWGVWPPPGDCHPTNDKGFWHPEPFDKTQLPAFMKAHPFYDLGKIE